MLTLLKSSFVIFSNFSFLFVQDVENKKGFEAEFGGCVRKGVETVIQILKSDTDGKKAITRRS